MPRERANSPSSDVPSTLYNDDYPTFRAGGYRRTDDAGNIPSLLLDIHVQYVKKNHLEHDYVGKYMIIEKLCSSSNYVYSSSTI